MNNLNVTTRINGMDEVDEAMAQAKEALDKADEAVVRVRRALSKVGLTVEQPPENSEG